MPARLLMALLPHLGNPLGSYCAVDQLDAGVALVECVNGRFIPVQQVCLPPGVAEGDLIPCALLWSPCRRARRALSTGPAPVISKNRP